MPQIISREQIILLCSRTLRLYDKRLVEHGERVAYLAAQILSELPPECGIDRKKLLLLSLFHDVGAYKTEQIDRMVEFEAHHVQAHSIYGYLFLKHFTPLGDAAEAVLYHHMPHDRLAQIDSPMAVYAELIRLADRADIAISAGWQPERLLSMLRRPEFDGALVSALERALSHSALFDHVRSGEAAVWVAQAATHLDITSEECVQYLKMLVYSIDFKSEFTVVHSVNTTVISLYLAHYSGMSRRDMERIYFAALVHDVGKMAIPEEILESPGRLDAEQMAIMRRHVEYTEEIVRGVLPEDITAMAVRHHEKLDGSGYPRGLSAEALSLGDRIVAVADIISALSSRRSYKEVYNKERTLSILEEMSEKGQLDAAVVTLTRERFDDLLRIMADRTAPVLALYESLQAEYQTLLKNPIFQGL